MSTAAKTGVSPAATVEPTTTAAMETAAAMPTTAMLSECRCRNASDCQRGAQRKDQFQEIGVFHFDPPANFNAIARFLIYRHTTFDCNSA
jgi:hypothetical protein